MRPALLAALALPLLAGCATLSEQECLTADWRAIGFEDGAAGRSADHIANHRRACAEVGVAPDLQAWLAGREQGLRRYCTPANAYRTGRAGRALSPVCPDPGALRPAYRKGQRYWQTSQDIAGAEAEIREIRSDLSDLSRDDPARARLQTARMRLQAQIARLRAERALYASWP